MFYDIRGISRCLHKCHLLLGNLPNPHNPLVLLKEKSSDETSSLHWLSYQKKEKKKTRLWNTGHAGSKTSGKKTRALACFGANSALGTLSWHSHICPALTLSLWTSPSGPWAASMTKRWIGLVTITVNQNQAPLKVLLLPWMCFNPCQGSAFHAAQDPPSLMEPGPCRTGNQANHPYTDTISCHICS